MKSSFIIAFMFVLAIFNANTLLAQEIGVRAEANKLAAVDARLFPLEDVRPGMKGTARTVFQVRSRSSADIHAKLFRLRT